MMRRTLTGLLVAATLAGCSSGVKLNDVPVEDKSGSAVQPGGPGGATGPATQSRVESVAADPAGGQPGGPANVARLVYFDYDSYEIKPEFQSIIDAHARYLRANTQRRVSLEGHTDERGGREYNLALGQRRAEAVRRAFGLLGVNDSQMEAVSFGKEKPAVPGGDESSWAQNRRVEISYR
ncbi:MAG TPA: peptidoglycan-associated lipoprotein Pal [Ramlibacter sp.]|jgi:peptidoglycan-associated lipoprotein|uniref:peptidoglycan-associated lipoprotein Pal n=1 Tax=Ramlibacter sp. TaxID=1917967 RepID=UPI002D4EB12A|nr:peptidoglycan-associated lipoprotein Pal [Ramlibacter sp.]HZY18485.1 peptidoglycan-associated lipoprotein Pal [Ramlibacter sp.]